MPRGDRTGPMGIGPRTGRGAGYCGGYGIPGYANPVPGWGFGMGYGRSWGFGGRGRGFGAGGWGRRNWFYAAGPAGWTPYGGYVGPYLNPEPELEKQALKNQADALQAELEAIKQRLSELEAGAAEAR
ncbi:MAG: DUF5320 domain-containing protein [Thermodesulfobacteriota bacterium]